MANENAKSEYLLEVRDLKQYFPVRTGFMKTLPLKAVDGVSFSIKPGETLGRVKLLWSFFVDKLQCFLTVQYVSAFS